MQAPSAQSVSVTPNAYGETDAVSGYASNIDYHANGSIKSLTYGNGRVYSTTQNVRQLPYDLKVMSGGSTVAHLRHVYDANANVTAITDYVTSSANRSMSYDDLDRLATASGIWGSGSYAYDAIGNICSKTEGGTTQSYTYDSSNRLSNVSGAGLGSLNYDARGNVTGFRGHGYTYNLAGNLTSSTNPSVSYQYDGHQRRVQKTEGGQTSFSMYSSAGTLMHKKVGGVSTDYIYAGSMLVAEKTGSVVDYMHTDLLGSPIKGTNGSSYTEHYTPWGEKWLNPVQLSNDVGYTGHQSDLATGLTYMQARYYDPVIGRFMAVDPVQFVASNPASFNRYLYVNDNPYKYNDPDGEFLNFAIKFAADVALNVAVNYVTTGEANLGSALADSAVGMLNPAATLKKAQRLRTALKGKGADDVPNRIPDDAVVVRGGVSEVPPPGQVFSGAAGRNLDDAAQGVPHGQVRATTAGDIRAGGGTVDHAPEPTRSGVMNEKHVNICKGPGACPFGDLQPNPVPKADRVK